MINNIIKNLVGIVFNPNNINYANLRTRIMTNQFIIVGIVPIFRVFDNRS